MMIQAKSRHTQSANAKRRSRRRLLVEQLENRVVLTSQNGLSPFVSDVPYFGKPSNSSQEDAISSNALANKAPLQSVGPQLLAGAVIQEKAVGASGLPSTSEPEFAPGQWITRFEGLDGAADQQVATLKQWFSEAGIVGVGVSAPLGLPGLVSLETSSDLSFSQLTASLSKVRGFKYASPDYKIWGSATYPNDALFNPYQYAQDNYGQEITGQVGVSDADIDAPEAWDLTTGSSSVVVGVIDSGIDFTHPDLIDNIWTNPNETPNDGIDNDSNGFIDDVHGWDFWGSGDSSTTDDDDNFPSDENGHGTHVSGTIGASGNDSFGVAGVNWDVSIVPMRFLGPGNYGWLSDAVRAINYATTLKNQGVNIKVTNNSWGGGGYYQALVDAIASNEAAGILFVAAAGNGYGNNNDFNPSYPASYDLDNIISVAATDNQDQLAYFSNIGPTTVDLGAPGVSILSTIPGGFYAYYNGTSMATPQVTGVAALAWSLAPSATYQQVKAAILAGVDLIPSLDGLTLTGGRLNAYNTLKQLGIQVVSTDPAVNEVVTTKPTQYVVDFSLPYDSASIDASDFEVNGQNADGFVLTDADTVTFTFSSDPVTSQGEQTFAIASGAIAPDPDFSSLPFLGFTGTFRYDALLLQVVSTTPPNPGGIFTLPAPFTYKVLFNEAIDPTSVTPSDLVLSGLLGATVSNVSVSADGRTASFTIAGIRDEGTLTTKIAAGAIKDVYGNDGASFSANYIVDYGTVPFPVPLKPVEPLGSLIYDATQRGIIDPAGDTDSFTIKVDPGQTITALVEAPGTLKATIKIVGSNGVTVATSTAAAAGKDALIQTFLVPGKLIGGGVGPSNYTVVVSGADGTTGSYKLQLLLNAAVEPENNGGSTNNTQATAFDISGSFLSLTNAVSNSQLALPQRGAVVGQVTADSPIVPNSRRDSGPVFSGNAYPFVLDPFNIQSMRYQQIYSADQFPNGGLIDEIRFRRYIENQIITDLQLDIEVRLSYAARSVTTASPVFSDNVGSDVTTVFNGSLTINSTSTTYPLPFEAVIDVDDKFFYDPSRGDLLVDFFVRDSNYPFPAYFESTLYPSEELATTRIYSFSVDAPTGIPGYYYGQNLPYGLVTQIAFDTPPDPVDWYKFELRSGQSASVALSYLTGDDAQVTLVSPNGTTLALSSPNQASNVDQIISNFVATTSGIYYLKVTSKAGATYSLVVDRNADFDAENNNSIATAQELISSEAAANRWVHGYLGSNTITVNASNTGWFDSSGYHNQYNTNYFVGRYLGTDYRDFFVFDLPASDLSSVVGAQLVLTNPLIDSGDQTETFSLFDVNTPIDQVASTSYGRTDIFEDLGSGSSYGATDVPVVSLVLDRSRLTKVNLGASGISAIKANAGGQLALGGAITSLAPTATQVMFAYSGYYDDVRQLQLELAESDFYKIKADQGRTIVIETSTPANDSGEFVNAFDPIIRLYDPAGNLVATNDNGASDGRNAKLSYKVPSNAGGNYSIEVAASPAKPTKGEYILSVKGSTVALPGFEVTDTDPSAGSLVYTSPQQIDVNFNDTVLATTLQGADLKLNGKPAAAATLIDGDTVRFQNNLAFQWTPELGGNGHYYALTSSAKTWQDAQAEAVSLGGNLVTVNNQVEQNFLKRVFFSGPDSAKSFWTGLNDIGEEGNFVWASGEPLDYTNWTPGEPNNFGMGEDGVQINFNPSINNGSWNDIWDTLDIYGIIELAALPSSFALAKEGLNTFSLASGAINDIQGTSLKSYSGSFTLDTTPPVVVSTSISPGAVISEGPVNISVTFSETMDTSTFPIYSLPVYGLFNVSSYYPSNANWSADGKTLTLSYGYLPEDAYDLRLIGGNAYLQDLVGLDLDGNLDFVEGGEFVLSFNTDSGTREVPTPLVAVQPASSLIYKTPYAASGTVVPNSDTDDWTIYVDPTQTLTILLNSGGGSLVGSVEILGPGGTSLGSAVGSDPFSSVLLQTVRASTAGVYTVRIGGANGSAGKYTFELTLNAALEEEAHGGPSNNGIPSAQSIEASFIPLDTGAERGAVRGVAGDDDNYSFDLTAGQSLNALVSFDTALQSSYGRTDYFMSAPWNVVFGDVNNDGTEDMVTSTGFEYYSQFSIRLGNGDGTFGNYNSFGNIYSYRVDLALADVNGDGNLDVIATDYYGGYSNASVLVYLGNGDGSFQNAVGYFAGYNNVSVAVGDVTGDGIPDIVTSNDSNSVYLVPGNGDGTFGEYAEYQVGYWPMDIALANVDGVNGLDIVTANFNGGFSGQSLSILLNQGDGTFGQATHFAAGYYNSSLAVGDLNGDGAPDIVTTNLYSSTVQVLFNSNDNSGSFGVPIEYSLSGYNVRSVALGDVSGDGVLDIVTGSNYNQFFSAGVVSLLTNVGDGSFGSAASVDSAYGIFGIALGDLNADGRLDIAAAGYYSYAVSVHLNIATPTVLTLFGPDGTELISSDTGDSELNVILSGFVAAESGTYTIRQSSPPFARNYSLLVTRELPVAISALFISDGNASKGTGELPLTDSQRELSWFNRVRPADVDDDGSVSPIDVLLVINSLNSAGVRDVSRVPKNSLDKTYYDVNNDGSISPLDVLQVINYINSPRPIAKGSEPVVAPPAIAGDARKKDELWSDPDQGWLQTERDLVSHRLAADVAGAWAVDTDGSDSSLPSSRRKSGAGK